MFRCECQCLFNPVIRLNVGWHFPAKSQMSSVRYVAAVLTLRLVQAQKTSWFGSKYLFQSAQTELEVIRLPLKNRLLWLLQVRLETSAGLKKKTFLARQMKCLQVSSHCDHTSGCLFSCNNANIFLFYSIFVSFCYNNSNI